MANKFKAQEDYAVRKKETGMSRTTMWVPTKMIDEIKDVALLMRKDEWVMLSPDEKPVRSANVKAQREG